MSCFWMYLSLIFVLQHSVSSDEAVSLNCNNTVKVRVGGTVTLNCSIDWKLSRKTNKGLTSNWTNSDGSELCNSMTRYTCEWDSQTYVSLTISDVYEDENVTVWISATSGMTDSSISVVVDGTASPSLADTAVIASTLSVSGAVLVGVILFVLYKFLTKNKHHRVEQKEPQAKEPVKYV